MRLFVWDKLGHLQRPFFDQIRKQNFQQFYHPYNDLGLVKLVFNKKGIQKTGSNQDSIEREMLKIKKKDKIKTNIIKNRLKGNRDLN